MRSTRSVPLAVPVAEEAPGLKPTPDNLVEFQRIPVRKDVEPKPSRLFRGYSRVVERPDDYKYFSDKVKIYQEIFKTR